MKKIAIYTLGCKTNQLESAKIISDFINFGWEIVDFKDKADLYIINTCTVTAKADSESTYLARKAKKTNSEAKVIITGCYAQVSQNEIATMEEVDLVIGNALKYSIVELISSNKHIFTEKNKILVPDIMQESEFIHNEIDFLSGKTRATIKIQDGCNNRCSYCIIPYARGKSRSNKLNNILDQIKKLISNNYKEIVLTGIHLGQWGVDLTPKMKFWQLLSEIDKISELERFRLGSLDPNEINSNLIKTLSISNKFCHHIHISIQSADDNILNLMRRKYSVNKVIEVVDILKSTFPDIYIGCDIITGFPGESDENFENTLKILQKLPLSSIHVFPYSKRKGTLAYNMSDHVPENIKKERAKILNELSSEKLNQFYLSQLNKTYDIIIENSRDKQTGCLKGLTDNYIKVLIEGSDNLKGNIVKVKINEINKKIIKGFILK